MLHRRSNRVEDSVAWAPLPTPNASQSPAISPHSGHGAAPHLQIIFASFAFFAAKIIPTPSTSKFYTTYTFYMISPHSGYGAAPHLQIIFAPFAFFAAKIIPTPSSSNFYTIYTFYTVILSPRAWNHLNYVA